MKSLNHNEGKEDWTLLLDDFPNALKEVLKVRMNGCEKYDRNNWKLSMGTENHFEFLKENRQSILRHIMQENVWNIDLESGCYHPAHIILRELFLLEYLIYEEQNNNDKNHPV